MIDLDEMESLPNQERMINPRNKRRKQPSHAPSKKQYREAHNPSEPEQLIATYLAVQGIKYVMEKTWPDLVSVIYDEPLPVDFWLPGYRVVLEIDGSHHRCRVKGDKAWSLDRRRLNDQTRNLFCLQRGFKLLRIRSDKMENYKEIINEFLKIK